MRDAMLISQWDQAGALLQPARRDVLRQLVEPHTCAEVGTELGLSPQRVNYHVQLLVKNDLVHRVGERRSRALVSGVFQAAAKSFWLSAALVEELGGAEAAKAATGHGYLRRLVEELQGDLTQLAADASTVAVAADVVVADSRRSEFLARIESAVKEIAAEFGVPAADATSFRLRTVVYPSATSP